MVVADLLKGIYHRGLPDNLFFYRDAKGLEVDILFDRGTTCDFVEIKSGQTLSGDSFDSLQRVGALFKKIGEPEGGKTPGRIKTFQPANGMTMFQVRVTRSNPPLPSPVAANRWVGSPFSKRIIGLSRQP